MTTSESPKIEVTNFDDEDDELEKELNTFIEENESKNSNKNGENQEEEEVFFIWISYYFPVPSMLHSNSSNTQLLIMIEV